MTELNKKQLKDNCNEVMVEIESNYGQPMFVTGKVVTRYGEKMIKVKGNTPKYTKKQLESLDFDDTYTYDTQYLPLSEAL